MKQQHAIISQILLVLFAALAILSPILNSNLWATIALLPFLFRTILLKNLKRQSIYIFFVFALTIILQVLGEAFSNINYSLRILITILALTHLNQKEKEIFLTTSFYCIGIVFLQLLTATTTISDVNLLAGERVLEWDIWGGHIQANIVGLYAAIGLVLTSLIRAKLFIKLVMSVLFITVLLKSGSRSALLFLAAYYIPVLIASKKNLAISLIVGFSLATALILMEYNFGKYSDNRFLSTDDSGRLLFYYQSLELFARNSYLPVDDFILEGRRIILDSLYLSSLIRFGPILTLAIILIIIRSIAKYDPNNISNRLIIATAILGIPESAVLGNTLLLALVLVTYTGFKKNTSTPPAYNKNTLAH